MAEASRAAEKIIAAAPHVETEQDLLEGYDYLAGSCGPRSPRPGRYERDFPYFIRSATPYTKVGLDNPDTLYFSARIRDDAEYVVTGRRGTTADLSFQILNGDYSPPTSRTACTPSTTATIEIEPDGSFELRFGPATDDPRPELLRARAEGLDAAGPRGVQRLDDRAPGKIRIQRVDRIGLAPPPPTPVS